MPPIPYWFGNQFNFTPQQFGGYTMPQQPQAGGLFSPPPSLFDTQGRSQRGPGGGQSGIEGPPQDSFASPYGPNLESGTPLGVMGTATGLIAGGIPGLGLAGKAIGNLADINTANQWLEDLGAQGRIPMVEAINPFSPSIANQYQDVFRSENIAPNFDPNMFDFTDAPAFDVSSSSTDTGTTPTGDVSGGVAAGNEAADSAGGDGGGSKIICTELYRQGYLSTKTYMADQAFGNKFVKDDPDAMAGYHFLAAPIVRKMKKSFWFARMVYFIVEPWTRHISGEPNSIGKWTFNVGVFVCRILGRLSKDGDSHD